MKELASARLGEFKAARFVLTDLDETLTREGRLSSATALERLRDLTCNDLGAEWLD